MKKIQLLWLALFAVFAFGAIAATSAFAAPEWLVQEAKLAAELPAETEGLELKLIKLISTTNPGILTTVSCSGFLVGTIGPLGADLVTGLLNLVQEEISKEELVGLAFECEVTFDEGALADCVAGSTALVWPGNLPWTTELLLDENPVRILDDFKNVGYYIECTTLLGIAGSELCEGTPSAIMENNASTPMGVLGTADTEEINCSLTGEKTGLQEGMGDTWAVEGTVALPQYLHRLDTLVDDV